MRLVTDPLQINYECTKLCMSSWVRRESIIAPPSIEIFHQHRPRNIAAMQYTSETPPAKTN